MRNNLFIVYGVWSGNPSFFDMKKLGRLDFRLQDNQASNRN